MTQLFLKIANLLRVVILLIYFQGNGGSSPLTNVRNGSEHIDCTPPDYILPGSTERPLLPLHIATNANKESLKDKLACLKVLTTSAWNPPPGQRRMHGDLM